MKSSPLLETVWFLSGAQYYGAVKRGGIAAVSGNGSSKDCAPPTYLSLFGRLICARSAEIKGIAV